MYKKIFILALSLIARPLASSSSTQMIELTKNQVQIPSTLGKITLVHSKDGFFIQKKNQLIPIQNAFIEKKLRNLGNTELQLLLGGESEECYKLSKEEILTLNIKNKDFRIVEGKEAEEIIKKIQHASSPHYIRVKQMSDGNYSLQLCGRLLGGGIAGAQIGFWGGKFLTHFAIQSGVALATGVVFIICPPAAAPFCMAVKKTIAFPAEALSNQVGLACGIAGAVTTGPV